MIDDLKPMLRLTTSRAAYRRAGLVIGSAAAPTLLTLEEFEQLEDDRKIRLLEDPAIEHAVSEDGVTFTRIAAELRAEAVDRYHKFMTGQAEGADKKSPASSPNASTASDATAVSGDDASQAETGMAAAVRGEEQPVADSAPAPVAASTLNSVNPTEATGDDAKGAAAASIGDDRNADVEKPGADAAMAPVASNNTAKLSGRAPRAAKPKASEAKAAS
ncbi:MAG: hypothetical protein ACT6Q7_01710 [Blastomonas fulva]|uniref:hypothetical protein n=1 Tax=Blastomonas fulva TaxID=1550728 RepID=UPI0040347992